MMPSKGPNSPYSVGQRTLLARTCTGCRTLADGDSFPVIAGGRSKRSTCHHCTNARKKQDRVLRGIGVPAPRPPAEQQTASWQKWTKADDTYLREHLGVLPYEDIATHLGRSVRAVYQRRAILGLAKVRTSHRVAQPWRVKLPG